MSSGSAGRLRDQVLVRHRDDRDVDARERGRSRSANIPPALTTTSASISPLSVTTPVTRPRSTVIAGDARVRVDLGTAPARTLGERVRQLGGIDVAVGRQVRRAEDAVGRHRREQPLRLVGRDRARAAARRSSPSRPGAQLLHPLRATRRAAATRPRASPSRGRPRRRACGRARRSSSSSSSG